MAYNNLSAAEAERIAQLLEECGEVVQACGKILRHGYIDTDRNGVAHNNRKALESECSDVYHRIKQMVACNDLSGELFVTDPAKAAKAKFYDHHQEST